MSPRVVVERLIIEATKNDLIKYDSCHNLQAPHFVPRDQSRAATESPAYFRKSKKRLGRSASVGVGALQLAYNRNK